MGSKITFYFNWFFFYFCWYFVCLFNCARRVFTAISEIPSLIFFLSLLTFLAARPFMVLFTNFLRFAFVFFGGGGGFFAFMFLSMLPLILLNARFASIPRLPIKIPFLHCVRFALFIYFLRSAFVMFGYVLDMYSASCFLTSWRFFRFAASL